MILKFLSSCLFGTFRNRIRMYPAFVNCTTIDWFSEWPADALLEVADRYLLETSLGSDEEVITYFMTNISLSNIGIYYSSPFCIVPTISKHNARV